VWAVGLPPGIEALISPCGQSAQSCAWLGSSSPSVATIRIITLSHLSAYLARKVHIQVKKQIHTPAGALSRTTHFSTRRYIRTLHTLTPCPVFFLLSHRPGRESRVKPPGSKSGQSQQPERTFAKAYGSSDPERFHAPETEGRRKDAHSLMHSHNTSALALLPAMLRAHLPLGLEQWLSKWGLGSAVSALSGNWLEMQTL
jgi:hypothetical protein